ncbi:hypothetical protein SLEP1_g56848 [Rubroshorea leprosula]|uniref:Uncharacterized protein n=1 Tax=Rubroshorea leprosula TaxID=152421 RepID=A0AAV5MJH5_9ROSI|nr:hypothetical protein SLEP1_g56848 [Rubroshorea leprosula]
MIVGDYSYHLTMFIADHRYWKQGVKLLAKPVAVGIQRSECTSESVSAVVEATFSPASGELTIKHVFS